MQLPSRVSSVSLVLAVTLVLALVPSLAAAQGSILVVDDDPGPGVAFSDLQAAVDAAGDGDLVLVRPGSYTLALLPDKALTLQVDGLPGSAGLFAASIFTGTGSALAVVGLSAERSVVVRGFHLLSAGQLPGDMAVRVADCLGPVLFEDCTIENLSGQAVDVQRSSSVTFSRCALLTGTSYFDAGQGVYLQRPGLRATDASVWLYGCDVQGSLGPDAGSLPFVPIRPPGDGGDGLQLLRSTLGIWGSSVTGGVGGSGLPSPCAAGGAAGDAVVLDPTSTARLQDTTLEPGVGGLASPGCGLPDGPDGLTFAGLGTHVDLPGSARAFAVASPGRGAASLPLAFVGEPGDQAFLLLGLEPSAATYFPGAGAALHLAPPLGVVGFGLLPASGTLVRSLPLPPLSGFVRYPAQALFLSATGELFHAGPTVFTIVDGAL